MPKTRRWWLWGLVSVLVVALVVAAVIKGRQKPKGTKVAVEAVQKRTIKEIVSASGKMYPEVEVKISSDVSGEIVELFVEEGDTVKQGQLLAKVDPDAYQSIVERTEASLDQSRAQLANVRSGVSSADAQIDQARAQIRQIEAQITNQKNIHQRNTQLLKDGVVSQADFEASQAQLRVLEGNLASAQANLKVAQAAWQASKEQVSASEFMVKAAEATLKESKTSLRRTAIYAPMNGIVSLLNVKKGERVVGTAQMSGTELLRIANFNFMEVQVEVSENDVLRVARGNKVEIEVDAYPDRKFTGYVTHIASSAANTATTTAAATTSQATNFIVKIRVDNESYQDLLQKGKRFPFRPGMSASVNINTNTVSDVLTVPIQAVTVREKEDKDNQKANIKKEMNTNAGDEEENLDKESIQEVVFVLAADSVAMRKVITGVQDDSHIQILTGLKEGEKVVSGTYTAISKTLQNGSKVEVVEMNKLYEGDDSE